MTKRRKVAISVSPEALAGAERVRKQTGESRSAVFERALYGLLAAEGLVQRTRRYVDGYRRQPEGRAEVAAALGTALPTLATEPWDETR
ncbi:MAG: hypothetical protein ACREMR_10840 [Gemmatimonadales bacterium]